MRHLTRKNIRLILLTILGIGCFMALSYTGKPHADFFSIGNLKIPSSTRSGILSGSLSLICFLLVFTDYKKGFKIALGIIFISIGNLLFGMIMRHSIVSLPHCFSHHPCYAIFLLCKAFC